MWRWTKIGKMKKKLKWMGKKEDIEGEEKGTEREQVVDQEAIKEDKRKIEERETEIIKEIGQEVFEDICARISNQVEV